MQGLTKAPAPRPGVLDIEAYVPGKSHAPAGVRLHKLSSNETPLGPSPHVAAAIAEASRHLELYPDPQASALKAALAERYGLNPQRIVCGNGSDELIALLIMAYGGEGTELVMSAYGFQMYELTGLWAGCRVIKVPERDLTADVDAMLAAVGPRTKLVFLTNPNNPTGAVYPRALLERIVAIAAKHELLLLCDEIYDGITYDDAPFEPIAPLAGDVPCVSFGGLSKVHRACGWRVGWALLSGDGERLGEFRAALDLLSALRLCANVPGQYAIEAAVNGPDTISELCTPGGRLYETRRAVIDACEASEHLSLVAPAGALYAFPAVVGDAARGFDDHEFALELMDEEGVLVVPGSSFNVPYRHHFRVTLLPEAEVMREVFARIDRCLARRAERVTKVVPLKSRSAVA